MEDQSKTQKMRKVWKTYQSSTCIL